MIFELAHQGGYTPSGGNETLLPAYNNVGSESVITTPYSGAPTPIVLHHNDRMDQHEDVDESLMLADREKEFIIKALKKHKGRRRDAANELGISERTLYRKIKEYDIKE